MSQDIPFEASQSLAFTPASLAHVDGAPSFTLRTPTWREKEFRMRLLRENSIIQHSDEAIRKEAIAGLKAGWTEEQAAEYLPQLQAFWEARDQFEMARRADDEAVWEYSPEDEQRVMVLLDAVEQIHPPLARMAADNEQFARLQPIIYLAIVVTGWTGLDVKRRLDRGYLSIDTAMEIVEALFRFEKDNQAAHGLNPGVAYAELYVALLNRFHLSEEEAKNSESPSQSTESPELSNTTSAASNGKSPARARSRKTRASA